MNVITLVSSQKSEEMKSRIIRIGNSRGIIIPAAFLKALALNEKDRVEFSLENGRLIIEADKAEEFNGPFTGPFSSLPYVENGWGEETDILRKNKELKLW